MRRKPFGEQHRGDEWPVLVNRIGDPPSDGARDRGARSVALGTIRHHPEAIDRDVPAQVITLSLLTRFRSRQDESYGAQVLAALRNEFGGHAVKDVVKAE